MTTELRKLSLLEWIANLSDEKIINELYESISVSYKRGDQFDIHRARKYAEVKAEKFDLEKLKGEQDFSGVDEARMDGLIAQLDIEQSMEDLLKDLD